MPPRGLEPPPRGLDRAHEPRDSGAERAMIRAVLLAGEQRRLELRKAEPSIARAVAVSEHPLDIVPGEAAAVERVLELLPCDEAVAVAVERREGREQARFRQIAARERGAHKLGIVDFSRSVEIDRVECLLRLGDGDEGAIAHGGHHELITRDGPRAVRVHLAKGVAKPRELLWRRREGECLQRNLLQVVSLAIGLEATEGVGGALLRVPTRRRSARLLHPPVASRLLGRQTLGRALAEQRPTKVLGVSRKMPPLRLWEEERRERRWGCPSPPVRSRPARHRAPAPTAKPLPWEGPLSSQEHVGQYTDCPHICRGLCAAFPTVPELWRHEVNGAATTAPLSGRSRDPKVDHFELSILRFVLEDEIRELNVAVHHAVRVAVVESVEELVEGLGGRVLAARPAPRHPRDERAASTELHD